MHEHAFDCRSVGLWGAKVRACKRRCEDKVYLMHVCTVSFRITQHLPKECQLTIVATSIGGDGIH